MHHQSKHPNSGDGDDSAGAGPGAAVGGPGPVWWLTGGKVRPSVTEEGLRRGDHQKEAGVANGFPFTH